MHLPILWLTAAADMTAPAPVLGVPLMGWEIVASGLTLVTIGLSAMGRVLAWPIGLLAVLAYAVVFWATRLYADLALQAIYLVQGGWGWHRWRVLTAAGEAPPALGAIDRRGITVLSARARLAVTLGALALIALLGAGLARWTDATSPYLDATCAGLSLLANGLLAMKRREAWALWVVVDVLYLWLFADAGLWWSMAVYAIALGVAARAWWLWHPTPPAEQAVRA